MEEQEKNKNMMQGKYSIRLLLFVLLLLLSGASSFTNADDYSESVIIENISSYSLDSSVIIYWDTNILSDSLVKYGLSEDNLTDSNYLSLQSYSHAAEIIGMIPNTMYYYSVNSTNTNGNSSQSEIYNFTTLEDNISPVFSNVTVICNIVKNNYYANESEPVQDICMENENNTSISNMSSSYSEDNIYIFSIIWKDKGIISESRIIHNFTGNTTETVMYNVPGTDTYQYNFSAIPVGKYFWKVAAQDISNNTNESEEYYMEIKKASPDINLVMDYGGENLQPAPGEMINLEQKTFVNIKGEILNLESGSEIIVIVSNSTDILTQTAGIGIASLIQYFENPGLYNISLFCNETQNYTSKEISFTVNVLPIELNIFIDKPEYNLGEAVSYVILAPNNSNLTIEVCGPLPSGSGFAECRILLNSQQNDYPYMGLQSFTNKSGTYKIRAQIQYKDLSRYAEKNYTVVNSIQLSVSGNAVVKTGDESNLIAESSGGIGTINYTWTLSNGTKIYEQNLRVKYNVHNTYPIIITAIDEQGNLKSSNVTLSVKKHFAIKFLVVDDSDSSELDSAKVKVSSDGGDSDTENTDVEGIAEFDLIEGEYDLRVSLSGYSSYRATFNSDSNKSIMVRLSTSASELSNEPLEISLVSPLNNTFMSYASPEFEAYIDLGGNTQANCFFYVSESNSNWYRVMKTMTVEQSGRISHSEPFSDGKMYYWKVQCDANSKTYSSIVMQFKSANTENEDQETSITLLDNEDNKVIDAGELRRKIDVAMTNYEALSMESKKDAIALRFSESVEKALRDYERAMRDINNIQYRRDLSEKEQDAKKLEYYEMIKLLEEKTPLNMENLGYQTFISYPSKEDLINISRQYQDEENVAGRVNENELSDRQNGIIVTTRISLVEITFINGEKKKITLVDKSLKISDNSTNTFLIEYIPKEFAESSDDLTVLSEYEVINKDPLLKFEKVENITYYVEGEKSLDLGRKINTVLMSDSFFTMKNSITGDVTLSNIDLASPTSLIIIIVIISCSYLIYAFDLFGTFFARSKKRADERNINKILGLIREARIFLKDGRISNADLTFKEIKLIYENSSDEAMAEVYSETMNLLEMIDSAQTEMLIRSADMSGSWLSEEEKANVQNSRKMLKEAYVLLSDGMKQRYGSKINSLIAELKEDKKADGGSSSA